MTDLDKAREDARKFFLDPCFILWSFDEAVDYFGRLILEQRAEEAARFDDNRYRGCPNDKHELGDEGICLNCNYGQRAADLRRQAVRDYLTTMGGRK